MTKPLDNCKNCGKCCMIFEIGTLTPEEADSGKYEMYEDHMFSGYHHIKKHRPSWAPDWAKQGVCIYLGQDMKCTIYNDRPGFCRDFYCRENGKLTSRYLSNRRAVNNPAKWTEYEHEAFDHFLKEKCGREVNNNRDLVKGCGKRKPSKLSLGELKENDRQNNLDLS